MGQKIFQQSMYSFFLESIVLDKYTGGNQGDLLQKESTRFCSLDTSGNSRASPPDGKTVNKGMSRSILSIFISL